MERRAILTRDVTIAEDRFTAASVYNDEQGFGMDFDYTILNSNGHHLRSSSEITVPLEYMNRRNTAGKVGDNICADGSVSAATDVGSTAIELSSEGSVVEPEMENMFTNIPIEEKSDV